jgi:phage tail protein X
MTVFRTKPQMLRVAAPVRYVAEVRYLLIAVAAALVISGCGAYRTGSGSNPSPTPSEGPGLGYDLVVTEKDRTATMRVGQKAEVVFHANSGMDNWMQVRSTNTSVLVPIVNPAATAVRGVTLAAFKAIAPGQAEIDAYANPHCPPGTACPMYVAVISIKVTVTP